MSTISELRGRFFLQPYYLKLATIACTVLGIASLLLPFLPGTHFSIGNASISQSEIWSTGVFIAILTVGSIMLLAGAGLLLAKSWARSLVILLPIPQLLPFYFVHWFLAGPDPSFPAPFSVTLILILLWAASWYLYLYRNAAVLEYFADAR
jgi:hypothetical protein